MGVVVPFPKHRVAERFAAEDIVALGRLADRLRPAGAVGWELDPTPGQTRAFIVGAEDETLLIVDKTPGGIAVRSGFARRLIWHGDALTSYA
ncbi:MAG: hypothetical protein HQ481_21640 [Alphaproteobacteria bacterium]|nr:hypothetical protein [Alphaproteobacteria bacterium]